MDQLLDLQQIFIHKAQYKHNMVIVLMMMIIMKKKKPIDPAAEKAARVANNEVHNPELSYYKTYDHDLY